MELLRQLVADGGNGFGLFPPSSGAVRLRLIATGALSVASVGVFAFCCVAG
jgi:hypothetical protein